MTAGPRRWTVQLTAAADEDFLEILRWTLVQFGERQAHAYSETLSTTLSDLAAGPSVPGVKPRDEIAKGIHSIHVARKGRKGRHFVLFRIAGAKGSERIEVLRILHDAMDLPRHLPPSDDSE